MSTVKRWFSEGARKEFQPAQDRLEGLDPALAHIGTTSDGQMQMQRLQWRQAQAGAQTLQAKNADLASKALEGFNQQQERTLRERDPEQGPGARSGSLIVHADRLEAKNMPLCPRLSRWPSYLV